MTWTPERVAELREHVAAGLSATQAGKKLGVTRNAAIGKAIRIGLVFGLSEASTPTQRGQAGRRNGGPALSPTPKPPRPAPKPRAEPKAPTYIVLGRLHEGKPGKPLRPEPEPAGPVVALLALEGHHCRWPIGSPQDPDFGFCGKRRAQGATYCNSCIQTRKPYLPTPKVNGFNPDLRGVRRSA